ncbi:hypothetical protein BPAE_0029g00500 [Botrytis paeoniae]|uniref:Uncharacterized protein n=1 Tax=Botrytis paeoniae TaxID=278948 RepID=A0A4Z1G2Z6_9HELO|nr:hypothetical protein BPAE_0029g00500 [Botrytis paeoniae]
MPGDEDEVPRLLRDRHTKAVRDKFHRPPTVNELRAIDVLPLESRKNLNDTSSNGQRIYEILRAFEKTGYVEGLEEAGRLLWAQIFAEPDFSQTPRREPFSAVRSIAACGISEVKDRASQHPTRIPKEKPLKWTSAEKVISINATSNAFAGSPQKPWMTRGVSISPTPRRASISSVENDNNNEPTSNHFQPPDAQSVSLRFAQSGQQTNNRTSKFTTPVPGGPPNTSGGGIYTPWPLHERAQEYQYASPYSTQASTTSMPYVPEMREPARDIISRANIPSNTDGESKLPVQQPIFHSNYTPNWKSESTDCNTSMGNSLHAHVSHQSYPSATLETNRLGQTTFSESTPQNSPWGYRTSIMSPPGNYSEYSPLPSANKTPLQPSNDAGYQNRQIASSTVSTYDPTSPPFHPAISAEGQQLLLLRKDEEKTELARITSNIHHSLSTLPNSHGDQQTESSSAVAASNYLSSMPAAGHSIQLATSSSSSQQSPSSDTSAVAPGQSSNNAFVIRDDMGFIPLSSQEITDQDLELAPNSLLRISSQRITRSVSRLPTKDLNLDAEVQAHYIPDSPPQQESFYSSASSNPSIEFIHFDPMKDYDNDDDAYTENPISVSRAFISHPAQPQHKLSHPTPTRPSPPPPHLRPHTPEYLLFPPTAASSSKQIWPPPPLEIDGYRQYTFVRDRISLNMKAKRRTEIDLNTGDYRYSIDSKETSRGFKMDGTRIRTSSRYFHKKRIAKKSKEKVEEERVDEIVRKVESVEKGVEEMKREEGDALLGLLGGGFLPM